MLRRLAVGMFIAGLFSLLLPGVLGRPPIAYAEAQRHRQAMFLLIGGGALLAVAGAMTAYWIDRSRK